MSNPRIPRKPGQPANSKKHSDLYTDENPKGTIHGLGFKDVATSKASVSKIRNSSRSHAHKIQAAVAMEQRAREMGKTSEAAVYRKFINSMKEKTKKMNEAKDHEYSMARTQLATVMSAAKRLRSKMKGEGEIEAWVQSKITKAADYLDTAADYVDSGEMNEEMKKCPSGQYYCFTDKKCKKIPMGYHVGGRGMLEKDTETKKSNGNGNGNGSVSNGNGNGNGGNGNGSGNGGSNGGGMGEEVVHEGGDLRQWFKGSKSKDGKGGWVNVVTGGTCASDKPGEGTPKCVSSKKRASMTKAERLSAARRKKKADPGQQQKTGAAKPTYVSTESPRKKSMKEGKDHPKNVKGIAKELDKAVEMHKSQAKRLRKAGISEGSDKKGKGSGTKDACYHKVKSRYSVWPSAYASGALVKCRKVGAANWGNKSEGLSWDQLTEKCWPGYEKKGMKTMFGKRYPNCVKKKATRKEQVEEAVRLPAKNGNLIDTYFFFRGKYYALKMFFPQISIPKKSDVESQVQKVYPGARLATYKVTDYEPGQPILHAEESRGYSKTVEETFEYDSGTPTKITEKTEGALEEKKSNDPCWDTHEMKGMKKKGNRMVPNCVPKEEFVSEEDYDRMKDRRMERGGVGSNVDYSKPPGKPNLAGKKKPKSGGMSALDFVKADIRSKYGKGALIDTKKKNEEVQYEDWQKENRKDKTDGLSQKAVDAYRKENPGSKLKTAVTKKPSELKAGSKDANRRKSFCSRMKGMKKRLTSAKTARDPDSRINKALRRWNC